MKTRATLATLAVLATLLGSGTAGAHPEWSPIRVNRYLKLVLADEPGARIVYTVLFGEGPAFALRKGADANADGRLDAGERERLGQKIATWVQRGLQLTLDGAAVGLVPSSIDVGLAGDQVAAEPFSVDLTYPLVAAAGVEHPLVIDDRVEVPSEGDSEVSIEASDAVLVAAHRGRATPGAPPVENKVFTFRGPRFSALEDRTVTVVLRPTRGGVKLPAHAPFFVGVALLVLAGVLALRRSYRSMKG